MSSNQRRKLFICGLNSDTGDEALREYFRRFGSISQCSIEKDSEGKSRGFGYVIFKKSSSTDDCMRSDPHTIDGNLLHVKVFRIKEKKELTSSTDNPPPPPAPCQLSATSDAQPADRKIFIGGLRPGINEDNIRDHFSQFGKLSQVLMMKHRDSLYRNVNFLNKDFFKDKLQGFAFVTFDGAHAVTGILEKQHIIKGRTL